MAIISRLGIFLPTVVILATLAAAIVAGHPLDAYWTQQDYLAERPEQAAVSAAFAERVRAASEPLARPPAEPVRITMVYPALQVSDYWRRSVASLEGRLKELGIPYVVDPHFTKPEVEVQRQGEQIFQALEAGTDYLVFTLDAARHRVMIERLIARGRPKVILQNITTPLRSWGENQPFLYVGFDHAAGSAMLADYLIKASGGRGDFALLYGPRGYVSAVRGGTFLSAVADRPAMSLKSSYYVGFDRARARAASLDALTNHPDIGLIYACSTDIALGAVDALRESGRLGQVLVNGWGGGSAELEAILAGELDVTVMRMNDDNGAAMAEAIRLDLEGRAAEVPTIYSGDMVIVSRETTRAELDGLKARAFRYSD